MASYIGYVKDAGLVQNGELHAWVFKNCPSYITCDGYDAGDGTYVYRYYFACQEDLFLFNLRWYESCVSY